MHLSPRAAFLLALASGCSTDPSTMVRIASPHPGPPIVDGRTGVLAVTERRADGQVITLRRIVDDAYVTLTPPIPDPTADAASVVWLDGSALVGTYDSRMFVFTPDAGWTVVSLEGCRVNPDRQTYLADARAIDDAWMLAEDYDTTALCHFDGSRFDAFEHLGFYSDELLEHDGTLYAVDQTHQRVMARALTERAWSRVDALGGLTERDDGVYAGSGETWWRVSGTPTAITGFPGQSGDRWRVDTQETTHESCNRSVLDGREQCHTVRDLQELHVMRVDGPTPIEAGYLRVENPDGWGYVPMAIARGQFLLAGNEDAVFATPPSD